MSNWGFDDNDDNSQAGNDSELSGPKALRSAYEAMKKQNDELNQKLTSFLEEQNKAKLASVFENLGIPGATAVYQGPADPKAAEEWAKSMQAVFNTSNQGGTPPVAEAQQSAEPTLPASMQAQFERMSEAGQGGNPTGNFDAANAAIGDASSNADIIAAFDRLNRM
jgi:hypothetical protein